MYHDLRGFTRMWDFTWWVSDLWRHLRKHLGRNATNYFLYQLGGACVLPPTPRAPASQPSQRTGLHQ